MAKIKIKKFDNQDAEFKWMSNNLDLLKAQRRLESKKTDGASYGFTSFAISKNGERLKATNHNPDDDGDIDDGVLKVRCIINATNILDSHRDLHIPGIWKKSISEKRLIYLCQEHKLTFEGIISDEVKASTAIFTFKELGYNYPGNTECLVFDAIIKEDRNEYMYNQYKNGFVRNHSVRMEYVKEYFCMNSENPEFTQYKENWNKFAPLCANQDDLTTVSWFYAITEAKIKDEGSAVVVGSCFTTPTLDISDSNKNNQAEKSLDTTEPPKGTQIEKRKLFIN